MFQFKRAIDSVLRTHPEDELKTLLTPWGETLDPENVLPEHPRPHMQRDSYENLNGWWDYAISEYDMDLLDKPGEPDGQILVPFSPEAALSHVTRQLLPNQTLWYERDIEYELTPGNRLLLHFEAVDFSCICYVNRRKVGSHQGGYDSFYFDITEALLASPKKNKAHIILAVQDPSEKGGQPRGKQRLDRGSIWYTAQSGIWQTVWLEEVPPAYIDALDVHADPDTQMLSVKAIVHGAVPRSASFEVELEKDGVSVAQGSISGCDDKVLSMGLFVEDPHLWTLEDPYLYDLRISYGNDEVKSYCAFRTVGIETTGSDSQAKKTFCLNHEPLFLKGVLDQGYWSDGLLTAPSDKALVFDIKLAKDLGFNMMRKHVKIESARWYYHCDRMGMLVWQDMVNGGGDYPDFYTSKLPILFPGIAEKVDDTKKLSRFGAQDPHARALWLEGSMRAFAQLRHFPCIAAWSIFNEGWGQFCSIEMSDKLRKLDATRPFDETSGWFDQGAGDFISEHNYFRTLSVPKGRGKKDDRCPFISEFGGTALQVDGHSALERTYGYTTVEDEQSFTDAAKSALEEASALEGSGLCGYVYTQLSDVEEEVNGFTTYNRQVIKVDLDDGPIAT